MRLPDFRVLTFDCYGTLIDWERGILDNPESLRDHDGVPTDADRVREAFTCHESAQQAETPAMRYPGLLTNVYRYLADEWGVVQETDRALAFGASVGR